MTLKVENNELEQGNELRNNKLNMKMSNNQWWGLDLKIINDPDLICQYQSFMLNAQ